MGRLVVDAEDVALGYLALARLQHARGDHATAQRTLETYIGLARQRGFVAHLIARGAAVQAQLALAQGDVAAAVAWADASGLHAADDLSFAREAEYLILARVWIAQAGSKLPAPCCRRRSSSAGSAAGGCGGQGALGQCAGDPDRARAGAVGAGNAQ